MEARIQAFPRGRWAEEFPRAASAGLDVIEWIFDTYGLAANPIETDEGLACIKQLVGIHGISIRSACADYFMDRAFVRATESERCERRERLEWLLGRAAQIGITRLVLPFVDQSAIRDEADRDAVIETLERVLPAAHRQGVELHLETSLPPDDFAALLARVPDPFVRVNYDSGNSSSLGYRPREELAAYGNRLGSVHIKDRVRGGGTVPLGEGHADFAELFRELRRIAYQGDFVLQVARGNPEDEVAWARQNRAFVERYLG
jgi:hexulose-6-phosphate isomerase